MAKKSPVAKNGLVEVYDAAQRCYMPGLLQDIEKNKVLVQFEMTDGRPAGKAKWFDWSVVREVPEPNVAGPLVEVRSPAPFCQPPERRPPTRCWLAPP